MKKVIMQVKRITTRPVIHPGMDDSLGNNITGPSLIRTPDWLPGPLGRYYLYFAHHNGKTIRLAYSDRIEGPWSIYQPGTLTLEASLFEGHIASPDVHIDNANKQILMYFHGSDAETDDSTPQYTRLAISKDGLSFTAGDNLLGNPYWRAFRYRSQTYALAMPGVFYRSINNEHLFERGPTVFGANMRHCAVRVVDNTLQVFYSNVGDCPESILLSYIDLSDDWTRWTPGPAQILLSPVSDDEGLNAPRVPSVRGMAKKPVYELRDPAILEDDQQAYLAFSVAGEQGISIARIYEV